MRIPALLGLSSGLALTALAGREVAITIDDLPRGGDREASFADTRRMTEKLLAPLRAGKVPVIGFVNECKQHTRELLPLWIAAGAQLGNHTCSHMDLNTHSAAEYEDDIIKGEPVTEGLVHRKARFFRHPFLHAGNDPAKKEDVTGFLAARGYRIAPVTLDNSDYMFALVYGQALARKDTSLAKHVKDSYVTYMDSIFDFFEKRSVEVAGHEVKQTLLIHASQLNADAMPDLLSMMKRRGYSFVTLEQALEDPAYALPEEYAGPGGFSWIHRWSKTKGMAPKGEPDEPEWITKLWKQREH